MAEGSVTNISAAIPSSYKPMFPENRLPVYAVFQLVLFTSIFIVGFFGNCIIIYGVMQQGKYRTTSNYFIANLALSDLAVLVISLPVQLLQELASWPFGEIACKVFYPLGDVFICVSLATLTIISADRYRAIVTPFKTRLSKRQAKYAVVLIWIFSFLVYGLPVSFLLKIVEDERVWFCYPFWPSVLAKRLHMAFTACLVTISMLVIAYSYIHIVRSLWQVRIIYRASSKDSQNSIVRLEQKRKLVKMLITIVIVFAICIMPYVLLAISMEFATLPRNEIVRIALVVVMSQLYLNSALNPVILCTMSKDYRKGLRPCGC